MSLLTLAVWIGIVYGAMLGIVKLLPDYELYPIEQSTLDSIQSIFAYGAAWDDVFPFMDLLIAATIVGFAQAAIWIWKGSVWTVKMFRGGTA